MSVKISQERVKLAQISEKSNNEEIYEILTDLIDVIIDLVLIKEGFPGPDPQVRIVGIEIVVGPLVMMIPEILDVLMMSILFLVVMVPLSLSYNL